MGKEPLLIFAYYNPNNEENSLDKLVYVRDDRVKSGKDCNCYCPKCERPLIARKGLKNAHHFAHENDVDCAKSIETSLHLMSKQIIKDANFISMPEYSFKYKGGRRKEVLVEEGELFHYKNVELEQRIQTSKGDFIPDALLFNDNDRLAIEIFVTHKVNQDKKERIMDEELSTLEININPREEWDIEKLRDAILKNVDKKIWVHKRGKKEILAKIEQHCVLRKFNSLGNVFDCPANKWIGIDYKRAGTCTICDYYFGNSQSEIYCSFDSAITERNDFRYSKEQRKEKQIKTLQEIDNNNINEGKCPICKCGLYVSNGRWCRVLCKNQCGFAAEINTQKKKLVYKGRYGKKFEIPLPEFVLKTL